MIEKSSIPKLIVLNSAVASPIATTRLFSPTTGSDVLAVNGVGVYQPTPGSGSPTAASAASVTSAQYIEVIKRRNTAGDKSPLPPRHYERSGLISLNCHSGLEWSGAPAEAGTSQAFVIGAPHGTVGAITPLDTTRYTFVVVADGAKTDKIYGPNTQPTLNVTKLFGDFGVDAELQTLTTDQQARDYIVSALVDKHNVLSSNQGDTLSIAVAIATDPTNVGTAVAYDLAAVTALTVGDYFIIGYNTDGTAVRMVLTVDSKNALLAMINTANTKAGVVTSSIVTYAMPSSINQTTLGATGVAGGQGASLVRIDMFGLITVDIDDAFYNDTFSTKRRLTVGLDPDSGFDSTVYIAEASAPMVGSGYGSEIKQWYKNVEHYGQYTSSKDYGAMHIAYPDDINESGYYDVYSLYYCNNRSSNGGNPTTSNRRLIIAVPNFTIGDATTNNFFTGVANTQKAALEAIINPFVARVGLPNVNL
jgi:hypothetical protein